MSSIKPLTPLLSSLVMESCWFVRAKIKYLSPSLTNQFSVVNQEYRLKGRPFLLHGAMLVCLLNFGFSFRSPGVRGVERLAQLEIKNGPFFKRVFPPLCKLIPLFSCFSRIFNIFPLNGRNDVWHGNGSRWLRRLQLSVSTVFLFNEKKKAK